MKRILVFLLLFSFCSDTTSEQESEMMAVESTTTTVQAKVSDETTTTLIQIEQLETFKDINYEIDNEKSLVSYLAPVSYTHLTLPTKA